MFEFRVQELEEPLSRSQYTKRLTIMTRSRRARDRVCSGAGGLDTELPWGRRAWKLSSTGAERQEREFVGE